MKLLSILFLAILCSCSKEHYEELTEKIKPLVIEPSTFTVTQSGKTITAKLVCEARPYERRLSYMMVFAGGFEVGRVEYIGAGVTERTVTFGTEGTLTSYYINHFSRYNP